ncbi:AAA family ATPase [Burkholderia multivorans]|jgi:predicted ATPase|uniref:AAA family ATPase n=2 Tax=Burkholderia multivorans TaxID=87883 RepID=UPI0009B8431A|nr:AAA family ATPase [Burkholderia multivorans]MBJ9940999.1 AAA family ATPase [Burkholderia multivorans]MBR7923883.1 AAA family ATPase [Burkholderia multivorans]MBR8104895.1 AAA family ATPase [Burkholderia multivorans]MBR8340311.1 AAA family ATPase [Burkholderia multivorans]MBU9288325.1 AAA family ATPase [Burkholderia multivorans]
MLTKLRVKGFKSLNDITVNFGPFTCVAGVNGAGKSNLFDAIVFLRDLADMPIIAAANRVRDRDGKRFGSVGSIFTRYKDGSASQMELEAEFLVPNAVVDDFGRHGAPRVTHLRYRIVLGYVLDEGSGSERILLLDESLKYIPKRDFRRGLFPHSDAFWDTVKGGTKTSDFISTDRDGDDGRVIVNIHQDSGSGRPERIPAFGMERTALSGVNTIDRPTALAARREMRSWALLQLEPSALRQPDDFSTPSDIHVAPSGAHMPATLKSLDKDAEVANRLSELLPDVAELSVEVDDKRELKTLYLTNRDGIKYPAKALSDGTLRFLALAIIHADPRAGGLICLEEPENGIHPSRVKAMTSLLRDMAVDPSSAISEYNPLRQVIINTHSPLVVQELLADDLVVCQQYRYKGATFSTFGFLAKTWRADMSSEKPTSLSTLLAYLNADEAGGDRGSATVGALLREQLELFH